MSETSIIDSQEIKSKIYTIRGIRVMLDSDLAELYKIETKQLKRAVKRNIERFPSDFMIELTIEEAITFSRYQTGTLKRGSNIKYLPYAFSELGVAMLSSILNTKMAIEINIKVMREFVEVRKTAPSNLENRTQGQISSLIEARMDTIEANHLVDHAIISGKVTKISKENQDIREDIKRFSSILDEFQNAHIIIKRPDEEKFEG